MPKKQLTESQQISLCSHIIEGNSLASWIKQASVSYRVVYNTLKENKAFSEQYTHARESQADTLADRILEVCTKLENRTIDPNSARVIIDSVKWLAGKLKPKDWSDKTQLEINHTGRVSMIDYLLSQPALKNVTPSQPDGELMSSEQVITIEVADPTPPLPDSDPEGAGGPELGDPPSRPKFSGSDI